MTQTTLTPTLEHLLRDWLPAQRWFPVKSPDFTLAPVGGLVLDDATGQAGLEVFLASVESKTADGVSRTDVVQIPLSYRSQPLPGAERALIGESDDAGLGRRWVYDAVHDPAFIAAWLDLIRDGGSRRHGQRPPVRRPASRCRRLPARSVSCPANSPTLR